MAARRDIGDGSVGRGARRRTVAGRESGCGPRPRTRPSDYPGAIELYRALIERGHDGGRLHYNLGNAYLRHGELGRAIASYLRARARLPRDEDLRANLDFARQSARDAIAPPAPPPLLATLFFWHFTLSRTELAWLVAALNLLLWSGLALRLWRPRLPGSRGLIAFLLVLLVGAGGSLSVRYLRPARTIVVVPQEIPAFTAPNAESVTRFKLHAGSELRLRGRRDGWLRVALPGGEQGWIQTTGPRSSRSSNPLFTSRVGNR